MEWYFKYKTKEVFVNANNIEEAVNKIHSLGYESANRENVKQVFTCDSSGCVAQAFVNNGLPKVLILGTHITTKSLDAGFCYMGVSNEIWKILSIVFNDSKFESLVEAYNGCLKKNDGHFYVKMEEKRIDIMNLLREHNVVLEDVLGYCKCTSMQDKHIIESTCLPNDNRFHYLQSFLDQADIVLFNGRAKAKNKIDPAKKSAQYFFEKYNFHHESYKAVASSSGVFSQLSVKEKAEEWSEAIKSVLKNDK